MGFGCCTFVVLLCGWIAVTSANTPSDGPDEMSATKERFTKLGEQQTNLGRQTNSQLAKQAEQIKSLQKDKQMQELGKQMQELGKQMKLLQTEQQEQQRELHKLLIALLDGKQDQLSESHMIKRRAVIGGDEKIGIDDLLRRLPIESLKSLLKGRDGRDGNDGIIGSPGVQGPSGSPGKDGTPGWPGAAAESAGAIYTRWGRTTCGEQSSMIYKGFAGRGQWDHAGGGVDYQCMPLDPEYNRYYKANGGKGPWYGSWMSGVEYQSDTSGIFPDSAHEQNAPCARCCTKNRSAVMMVPGKRTCPTHWTKEYEGYLMTAYHNHNHPATYECVDAKPEYIHGLTTNTDGGLFYFVRADCGKGGHCPPYDGEKSLTCVVCSK